MTSQSHVNTGYCIFVWNENRRLFHVSADHGFVWALTPENIEENFHMDVIFINKPHILSLNKCILTLKNS